MKQLKRLFPEKESTKTRFDYSGWRILYDVTRFIWAEMEGADLKNDPKVSRFLKDLKIAYKVYVQRTQRESDRKKLFYLNEGLQPIYSDVYSEKISIETANSLIKYLCKDLRSNPYLDLDIKQLLLSRNEIDLTKKWPGKQRFTMSKIKDLIKIGRTAQLNHLTAFKRTRKQQQLSGGVIYNNIVVEPFLKNAANKMREEVLKNP